MEAQMVIIYSGSNREGPPYICPYSRCRKRLSCRRELYFHVVFGHPREKLVECFVCYERMDNPLELDQHLWERHWVPDSGFVPCAWMVVGCRAMMYIDHEVRAQHNKEAHIDIRISKDNGAGAA